MSNVSVLICDIGGTNIRFGIYKKNQEKNLDFDGKYPCVQFRSFEEAVALYLKGKKEKPTLCVIGAAGELNESATEILGTNTPWKTSIPKLKAAFPFFKHVRLVNDFALQGWALSELDSTQYMPLFSDKNIPLTKGKIVVIGPGTGLGTCLIMTEGKKKSEIYTSEAGHCTIPHVDFGNSDDNALRDNVLKIIKQYEKEKGLTPVVEHIVSGTGITNLYHAIHDGYIPTSAKKRLPSETIEKYAQAGDPSALKTFQFFSAYLGAHTGSLIATTKTKHVFFCGGLMMSPWIIHQLETTPDFMHQLTSRSLLSNAMRRVHFSVSKNRDMAKLGAVVRARQLLDLDATEKTNAAATRNLLAKLGILEKLIEREAPSAKKEMASLICAVSRYERTQKLKEAYPHRNRIRM